MLGSNRKVSVLIVDDEALLREGVRSMLLKENFIKEVYEAGDAEEFKKIFQEKQPDIILLDIRLRKSSGLELIAEVKSSNHQPKLVAVTGLDGVELMVHLLKSGVNGIVYKLDGYAAISAAIKSVLNGDTYFPDNILRIIQSNATQWDNIPAVVLSFQEKELLKAIASGVTTKEIAIQLKMTEATAETYRVRLIKKLGVSNTAALLAYAYRNGIL